LSEFASFAAIKVGDETRVRRRFTADAVDAFARVSGDDNPLHVDEAFAAHLSRLSGETIEPGTHNIFTAFPMVQFVDYTKNHLRFNRPLPANYHLTFSLSETNEQHALDLLSRGHNVAIVFGCERPATWHGYRVIDGDEHDLRHLDPRNVVVGLTPKGSKAKRDTSGFVVRGIATIPMAA